MILYHQNNSYLKFNSSFNIWWRSPNDVSSSILNIAVSSFPLPTKCCLQSCTVEKRKVLVNCCLLRKFMIVTDYLVQLGQQNSGRCNRCVARVWKYEIHTEFLCKISWKMTSWKTKDKMSW
jgi:hypothetical protein